jgi:hypothetical protein
VIPFGWRQVTDLPAQDPQIDGVQRQLAHAAHIPALLEQAKTEIAAIYGVKLGSLKVLCSRHGISLRKGGPLPKRTNLTLRDEPLPLSDDVLKSLRAATRAMGKDSTARLVSDLLERIVSDDLYKAVLDEEMA